MNTECKLRGDNYEYYLSSKFDLTKDEEILKVLELSKFSGDEDIIDIKEVNTKMYHNVTKLKSYMTEDSIYTDGKIVNSEYGKAIVDFSVALIFKKEFHTENLKKIDIIINGSSKEECNKVRKEKLAYYINPNIFDLLLL